MGRRTIAFAAASGVAALVLMPADLAAQARAATGAPTGWLASPIREEPSPALTSLSGVGTANAAAEARMTPQGLTDHCQAQAHLHPTATACLEQMQRQYANRIFRASADCTAGRITTTGEQTYVLDGLWDSTDIGAGRTRWRDADGFVVGRDLVANGLHISQQWETLCPGPVSAALIARAASAGAPPAQQARAGQATPPVCGADPLCTEVDAFAVTILDFRASLGQPTKVLTVNARFQNKLNRPIVLGYVPRSGVAIDERNNQYAANESDIRGIGVVSNTVDAKFALEPGQAGDARLTYVWRAGREVYGTTFDVELTVREILPLPNGQVTLGSEHPLRIVGLVDGARAGRSVPAAPSTASVVPSAGTPAQVGPAAAPPADHCAVSRTPCYDAGAFSATVSGVTGTVVGSRHHQLRIQLSIQNHSDRPLILAYKSGTNAATDNLGNPYVYGRPGTHDTSFQGIGLLVPGRSSDSQFRLAPGESRNAIFTLTRFGSGAAPQGRSYAFDTVLAELQMLPNGTQTEIVREHSVHLADLTPGGAAGPSSESVIKALDALRGILKRE
jgi:hypothetical protein